MTFSPSSVRVAAAVVAALAIAATADAGTDPAITRAVADLGRSEADRARDATSKPADVLQFFGLEPGMQVIDLFGGGGYYSELVASVVGPTGGVTLHDNQAYLPYVGEELETRFADGRLGSVIRIVSEADNLQLPANSADMILMVMCYHDLYYVDDGWPEIDRKIFWDQVLAALKPGGMLAVIDHVAEPGTGSSAAQKLHRIDMDFAKHDIEAAGFVFVAESEVLRNPNDDHTLVVFDPAIRRKTDRFVYKFKKLEGP
jgi:predicted methyltransferase